jgi:DNA-binding GntR family transcriptional regulator
LGQHWEEEDLLSIRERAYLYLKELILEGEFNTGDRLVERELAEKLKISRTPIREALFRLESQGFVKTVPRKGVVVSHLSNDEIIEVFTILSSLEVLAVKLAAQKLDDQTKNEFEFYIEKLKSALAGDESNFAELHIEINYFLYKSAKSPKLYEILTGLMDHIRAFAKVGYEKPGRRERSMEEHREIMQAICNREFEMAEYLTKIHIENSKKAYIESIKQTKADKQKN